MKTIVYKYAHYKNEKGQTVISARSTYAGKTVKGYAKCDPRDAYDVALGEKLAAARCEAKIAQKRVNNAGAKVQAAKNALADAQAHLDKMLRYQADATNQSAEAQVALQNVLKEIG